MKSPLRVRLWSFFLLRGHQRTAYAIYCALVSPFHEVTCRRCGYTAMQRPLLRRRFITHMLPVRKGRLKGHEGGALCRWCHADVCGRRHRGRNFTACAVTYPGAKSSKGWKLA